MRFRKFSAIDREHSIFELVENGKVILDVSATDDGVIEVAIHEGALNRSFPMNELLEWIEEGRTLVAEELEESK